MLSKNDELFMKLGESFESDSQYLTLLLEQLNNGHENTMNRLKQGLQMSSDEYQIKMWNNRIALYERMIDKNKQLIDKLK